MRRIFLPFSPPLISEEEINEVVATLRSQWITTGPKVMRFEEEFARFVGAPSALAVSSCTAALHLALLALGIGPNDQVITTPMTFASTVHAVEHVGARPVLVDVEPDTLNLDPNRVADVLRKSKAGKKVGVGQIRQPKQGCVARRATVDEVPRAILPVHLYGHPCDLTSLTEIARAYNLALIEDAAHALPATYKGRIVGSVAPSLAYSNFICFSFYATKNLTTAEGGMLTGPCELLEEARLWSQHGITRSVHQPDSRDRSWKYEVVRPGFKYNMTDIQAAIGLHQLTKLHDFQARRREIVGRYNQAFSHFAELHTPIERPEAGHAWHLYVLRLNPNRLRISRDRFIEELKIRRIGTSVHFIPIHLHPHYRDKYGYKPDDFPVALREYRRLISLPLNLRMSDEDVEDVIQAVTDIVRHYRRRPVIVPSEETPKMFAAEAHLNQNVGEFTIHSRGTDGIEVGAHIDELLDFGNFPEVYKSDLSPVSTNGKQRERSFKQPHHNRAPFAPRLNYKDFFLGTLRREMLQETSLQQLIGREPVHLDLDLIRQWLQGKRALVTGAGGAIGLEICRQLAACHPELLILFERTENDLYAAGLELGRCLPGGKVASVLGDISDRRKIEEVIKIYSPDVLYHTAAYKHVPLMEHFPLEAMENNIFGTATLALAAQRGRVKKFVYISTDKAVKPIAIMGMTKRVAENLLLSLNGDATAFVVVRLSNILASPGSAFALFLQQICNGEPVTITDVDSRRHFLLLSEAARLVLLAGAIGQGGEIVYLDPGKPVRILDLAKNLIRLFGLEPGEEVPLKVIGLRPGEKLREELATDEDTILPTSHERLFVIRNSRPDRKAFWKQLERLRHLVAIRERNDAVVQLRAMATRY